MTRISSESFSALHAILQSKKATSKPSWKISTQEKMLGTLLTSSSRLCKLSSTFERVLRRLYSLYNLLFITANGLTLWYYIHRRLTNRTMALIHMATGKVHWDEWDIEHLELNWHFNQVGISSVSRNCVKCLPLLGKHTSMSEFLSPGPTKKSIPSDLSLPWSAAQHG